MLITGCSNSLLTKFQDKQCISNCSAPPAERLHFDQPVVQTVQMFLAELGVGLVVLYTHLVQKYYNKARRQQYQQIPGDDAATASSSDDTLLAYSSATDTAATDPASPAPKDNGEVAVPLSAHDAADAARIPLTGKRVFLLAIPATCDILGTTLMNVGLLLVPVSIYQMVRGAIVLFVGLFSVLFLKRHLLRKQWIGLLSVFGGVFIVGLSAMFNTAPAPPPGALSAAPDPNAAFEATLGISMILLAQIFAATQFVLEEFILEKYAMEPVNVVMWEGAFGTSITLVGSLLIFFLFVQKRDGSMFNLPQGAAQMFSNKAVLISSFIIMFMMSTFNVTGMAVTRIISATSRSTIDTSRTVGIWIVSLLIGWETFQFLQLVGFGFLVYGTLLFNGIIDNDEQVKEAADELLPHEFEHT